MIPAGQEATGARGVVPAGMVGAAWGVAGVVTVLAYALTKLAGQVAAAVAAGLEPGAWVLLGANVAFMVWAEGIRGFQQRFSPRVAARALALARAPEPLAVLLAPLYCAGFFRATPRVLRITWGGATLIVLAVLLVQGVPQPWRGILDAGVVAGLAWGAATVFWCSWQALRTGRATADPEVA